MLERKNLGRVEFSQALEREDWARTKLQERGNHSGTGWLECVPGVWSTLAVGTQRVKLELSRGRAIVCGRGVGLEEQTVQILGYVLGREQTETANA